MAVCCATALIASVAGCGSRQSITTVPAHELPFNLGADPNRGNDVEPSGVADQPSVYFTSPTGVLTPERVTASSDRPEEALLMVLDRLAAGPTPVQIDRGLRTDLPAGVQLRLVGLSDHTATISIGVETTEPVDAVRATGQVVLSVTSVPSVTLVQLVSPAGPLEAPLPDGRRSAQPLSAAVFDTLRTRAQSSPDRLDAPAPN